MSKCERAAPPAQNTLTGSLRRAFFLSAYPRNSEPKGGDHVVLNIDPKLFDFCTPRQREVLEAIERAGGANAAAGLLKCDRAYPSATYRAVVRKAALQGYSPAHDMTRTVPEGFKVRGVSTYYDSEGQARGQWVKSSADDEAREAALREALAAMCGEIPPADPVSPPAATQSQLCNLYTYSDFHMGMLAWHKEGGADWDLGIAERTLIDSFRHMVLQSPQAHTALINIQGDFLHSDGLLPVTPAHKNVLDQDGRFSKIVAAAIRSIRQLVAMALERHQGVHLLIAEGNHDEASSVWLRHMFTALYENEPRVTVNDSELPYYVFTWGDTLLGFHHGHKVKNEALPAIFAAQFRKEWGEATRCYIHCGHRHHADEKEYSGATVIQHPTLAARDAYAARGGWIADRAVQGITYHRRFGQVGRTYVAPEMLAA